MTVTQAGPIDSAKIEEEKIHALLGKVVGDLGGLLGSALVVIGDKLGLYTALAEAGPLTSVELAERTSTAERYVREWLINQAASGYVEYDPSTERYSLSNEQAVALTDPTSPFFVPGGFQAMLAVARATPRIVEAFRTGAGMAWGEHDPDLFVGTERFFKAGYVGNLVQSWIPALDGVQAKLEAGATVADVGCGHGASTIILAEAFPRSRFIGFDSHEPSIERAREAAVQAGVADRVSFEVAGANNFADKQYELIAFFDCLHDMSDPLGAARHAREVLAPDGTVLLVEPMAGERVEDNFNPVGRVFSGASVLVCTPNAIAGGGSGLGTVATDGALRDLFAAAGFSRFRRATETPFNRIFEARP